MQEIPLDTIDRSLMDALKARPDHAFVGPEFIAIWNSEANAGLIIDGDFRHLSDEQVNSLISATCREQLAKQ